MDPAMMTAVMTALSALSGLGGKDAKMGSTYSKQGLSVLDDMLANLKGGAPDITQNQQFQTGQDWLQSMFNDQDFFDSFEAPMQRQFQEQTVPDLANRFASMGSGGALGSTGFRNQLAREGSNLQTNIAAMRGGMQQNAIPQMLQYAQQPFSNYMTQANTALQPTNNMYQPASSGFFGGFMPQIAGAFAQGWGQQQGQNMGQNNKSPGQSPSTY